MAQLVERVLGKDEVSSSNLDSSSKDRVTLDTVFCFVYNNKYKLEFIGDNTNVFCRAVPWCRRNCNVKRREINPRPTGLWFPIYTSKL